MSRVRIINTGGTLSMRPSAEGFRPSPGFLAEEMSNMSELRLSPMPDYDIHEFPTLIDSSNVTPAVWLNIAKVIEQNYAEYDGFVILHGTDTLAHTASALPLMLCGLDKPVVLTGAQLPLGQLRNDARENLKTAMVLAANYAIPEVSVFFNDRLFRGCRTTKVSAIRFDAMESPNYPPLAIAETSITLLAENIARTRSEIDAAAGPGNTGRRHCFVSIVSRIFGRNPEACFAATIEGLDPGNLWRRQRTSRQSGIFTGNHFRG